MNARAEEVAEEATAAQKVTKKTEYETVKMEDGSEEKFAVGSGDRQRILNKSASTDEHGSVHFRLAFRNGRVLKHTVGLHDALRSQYIEHGGLQKLGDETAGAKTVEDAVDWVENLLDLLKEGKWSVGRAPGSGEAGISILAQAILVMREEQGRPLTKEQVRAYLRGKTQKAKLQLRADKRIAAIIKRIEEEAGKATPEESAALADEIEAL